MKTATLNVLAIASAAAIALAGCPDDERRPVLSSCSSDGQCEAGLLCIASLCLDPAADNDLDGLINEIEGALSTDPLDDDSDGDGVSDGDEIGGDINNPVDTDGDGIPDALESLTADDDRDCLPNQLDAQNDVPETDPAVVGAIVCSAVGACGAEGAVKTAACDLVDDVPTYACDYSQVPGYEVDEESCDDLDNDCDGDTDEGYGVGGDVTYTDEDGVEGKVKGDTCGIGACAGGAVVCAADKASLTCSTLGTGTAEACDDIDNDCDGEIDEGRDQIDCDVHYYDDDGDGFGVDDDTLCVCEPEGKYSTIRGGDCDDDDTAYNPGAAPICGEDADCDDALLDAGEPCDDGNDVFGDGCLACEATETALTDIPRYRDQIAAAALADGGFVAAWYEYTYCPGELCEPARTLVTFYDADGAAVNEVELVGGDLGEERWPRLTLLGDGQVLLVTRRTTPDGGDVALWGRLFDAAGEPAGDAFQITAADGDSLYAISEVEVSARGAGRFVVAWIGYSQQTFFDVVQARIFDGDEAEGEPFDPRGELPLVDRVSVPQGGQAASSGRLRALGFGDGSFLVSWIEFSDTGEGWIVELQRFDASGEPVGDIFFGHGPEYEGRQSSHDLVGLPGGAFAVVYREDDSQGEMFRSDLVEQRFGMSGAPDGEARLIWGGEVYELTFDAAALDSGAYVVVLSGYGSGEESVAVRAWLVSAEPSDVPEEIVLQSDEFTNSGFAPVVAAHPTDFFLTLWTAYEGELGPWVYFQRLGPGGDKLFR